MQAADKKATYGLISRTIIKTLAKEGVNLEKASVFCLYMHWGIIKAYPNTLPEKKVLASRAMNWLLSQYPELSDPFIMEEVKKTAVFKKVVLKDIYSLINTNPVVLKLEWYKVWENHCAALFSKYPSYESFLQVITILQETMSLKSHEVFTAIYLVYETLNAQLPAAQPAVTL